MQLVDRALKALELISREPQGMSVSELSQKLDIPASSAHRVLAGLKDNHFVTQNEETKKYHISYKIFNLCSAVREQDSLIALSRPYMRKLSQEIQKTVILCVMSGDRLLNLDCVENSDASIYMVKTGKEMPLYSTSAGRVFAAYMPMDRAMRIFERTARRQETPYTKTDLKELLAELQRIRRQGYAVIDEELQVGVQGVACPLQDGAGRVVAALALTTVKSKNSVDEAMISRLKFYAGEISKEIS